MVAYNFMTGFVAPIEARTKRQTIRGHRKRHARPGEPVQLFTGMRTRHCRKIIADPVCVGVDEVRFDLRDAAAVPTEIARTVRLEVNGLPLIGVAAETYAIGDGFAGLPPSDGYLGSVSPFGMMAYFWYRVHGLVLFDGVAIRWEPRP